MFRWMYPFSYKQSPWSFWETRYVYVLWAMMLCLATGVIGQRVVANICRSLKSDDVILCFFLILSVKTIVNCKLFRISLS